MTLNFVINGTYFLVAMQFINVRLPLFSFFAATYQKDYCIESITCYDYERHSECLRERNNQIIQC